MRKSGSIILVLMLLFANLSLSIMGSASTNVEVTRHIDESEVAPGGELNVTLSISVSEDVNAMIVTEKLPPEFTIKTCNPFFSKYNLATGNVSWLFYRRTGVDNTTITYTVEVSTNVSDRVYRIGGNWSALCAEGILHGESPSTEVRVERLNSTLSLSVSPLKVKVGESITISGSISPILPNVNITLTYLKPDSSALERNVTTSTDGGFVDTYKVDAGGSWGVTASWPGDSHYEAAESPKASFTVESSIEQWQIFAMISIMLVSVLAVVMFLLRKR